MEPKSLLSAQTKRSTSELSADTAGSQASSDMLTTLEQDMAKGTSTLFGRIVNPLLAKHPRLLFIMCMLVSFLGGGGGGIGVTKAYDASQSSNVDYPTIAYIRDATITDIANHYSPIYNHDIYMCKATYNVGGKPKEVYFKDVDEGNKINSTDVYGQCQDYAKSQPGQLVTLLVSGQRDRSSSDYCNILQILPQDSTSPSPTSVMVSDNGLACD